MSFKVRKKRKPAAPKPPEPKAPSRQWDWFYNYSITCAQENPPTPATIAKIDEELNKWREHVRVELDTKLAELAEKHNLSLKNTTIGEWKTQHRGK